MKKHILWMIIGCGLPLLLIFFAPALGISSSTSLFIFILAMFACHLLMPMHGGHKHSHGGSAHNDQEEKQQDSKTLKTENHEHHH